LTTASLNRFAKGAKDVGPLSPKASATVLVIGIAKAAINTAPASTGTLKAAEIVKRMQAHS
jgi:hypothetical protein